MYITGSGFYPTEGATNRTKSMYGFGMSKRYFLGLFKYLKNSKILLSKRGFSYELTEKDLDSLVSDLKVLKR